MEVSRCYVTEKEHGLRLTLEQNPKNLDDGGFQIAFSKKRNKSCEWYVRLDSTINEEGTAIRTISLCHVITGKYLYAGQDGTVSVQDFPSTWTTWIMEPIVRPTSPSNGSSGQFSYNNNSSNSQYESNTDTIYYSLLPKAFAPRKVSCTMQYGVDGGGAKSALRLHHQEGASRAAVWEFEFTSGELCFISNPVMHSQIRCNIFGKLSLSSVFQGWEVFRFIEVGFGHVAISSWTHSHKYLSSDPDGSVFTTENRLGHWEKWALEKTDNGVYIISVAHPGRYLSVGRGAGEAFHTTTKPGDFAKWHLDAAHAHLYYLSSVGSDGRLQVSSRRNGPFVTKNRRAWEQWRMERTPDGDVTLYSKAHEKYLGCNSNGNVHTTSSKGNWSIWEMQESPFGGVFLKSKDHERTLAVQNETLCTTTESLTEAETFRLEPRLPSTMSGSKMAAMGAAGAVGLALTVAMPYAVIGVMEAAGLAATELSILAGISAEALIGAGGGALLGAGVVGTTAAVVKDEAENNANLSPTADIHEDHITGVQRPISAWRNW